MMRFMRMAAFSVMASACAAAQTPASTPAAGHWVISGDVQGVSVAVTCDLTVADDTLAGTCIDGLGKKRTATGTLKDGALSWSFPSEYEGNAITLNFSGKLDDSGARMSGSIYCPEYQADGTFGAKKTPVTASAGPDAPAHGGSGTKPPA